MWVTVDISNYKERVPAVYGLIYGYNPGRSSKKRSYAIIIAGLTFNAIIFSTTAIIFHYDGLFAAVVVNKLL